MENIRDEGEKLTESVIILFLLGGCAWQDYRRKQILIWPVALCAVLGIIGNLILVQMGRDGRGIWEMLLGAVPGAVLLLTGKLSRWQIGAGDGLVVMVMGIFLGCWTVMEIFFYASIAAGITGFFLFFVCKKRKSYEIPFLPFLLAAFVLTVVAAG